MSQERTKALKVDPPESDHAKFKKLCVDFDTNMKARLLALIRFDIANWQKGIDVLVEPHDKTSEAWSDENKTI